MVKDGGNGKVEEWKKGFYNGTLLLGGVGESKFQREKEVERERGLHICHGLMRIKNVA